MNRNLVTEPTVFVVDDDAGVRRSVRMLMEAAGHPVVCFDGAEAFLQAHRPDWCGCVLLDMVMNGMSGPALHDALNARGIELPIIYLTAYGDVPGAVQAMRRGAVDFLVKPVRGRVLLAEVERLLAAQRSAGPSAPTGIAPLEGLTPRQIEIARQALAGATNKEIARKLGISHRTVEFHRTQILNKTRATSFLQLAARLASPSEIDPETTSSQPWTSSDPGR